MTPALDGEASLIYCYRYTPIIVDVGVITLLLAARWRYANMVILFNVARAPQYRRHLVSRCNVPFSVSGWQSPTRHGLLTKMLLVAVNTRLR